MTKILLVEDNEMNQDMLSRRLLRRGYELAIADNGKLGVSMALSEQPDLILMDMSLPVMDGWEATRRLKADSRTAAIPIIALTAHAMVGDREKALEAGCDDYETKPVELPSLLQKIETLLAKSLTPQAPEPAIAEPKPTVDITPAANLTPGIVLVVDDNDMNRDMLGRRLQRAGYTVLFAADGEEGLKILSQQVVDLVLLDIMMPGIGGLETLKEIRKKYSQAQLPAIMATAKDRSEDIVQAFDLGANDYITKPIDFPVALARVKAQLSNLQVARQSHTSPSPTQPVNLPQSQPTVPQIILNTTQLPASLPFPETDLLNGRYKILQSLSQDQYRTIYLALDAHQPESPTCEIEKVSLTTEQPDAIAPASDLFSKYYAAFAAIESNYIAQHIDNFAQLNNFYIVKKFTEGKGFQEELNTQNSKSVQDVINVLVHMLKIVEVLHRNDFAHEDIQPLTFKRRQEDGQLVLVDSGIAARFKSAPDRSRYMATAENNKQPMFRKDIFAVGKITIQALMGGSFKHLPHNLKARELIFKILSQKDKSFARILEKMTCEDPACSYMSANDVLKDIHSTIQFS